MSAQIAIQKANLHQKISIRRLLHSLKNKTKKLSQNNKKFIQGFITGEGFNINK